MCPSFLSWLASFKRWTSPPLRELVVCPKVRYSNPTSFNVFTLFMIFGLLKKFRASTIVKFKTSTIFLSLYRKHRASSEYLVPPHASHEMDTRSANATYGVVTPFPLQTGQAPKELKVKRPTGCSVSFENIERISSIIPI